MSRTDTHRPSAIIPDDYSFVACEHVHGEEFENAEFARYQRDLIRQHMAGTGGHYSHHEHGGNCHVCGSVNLIYSILYYHEKSNTYIRVGEDCASKLDMGGTHAVSAFRAASRNYLEAKAGMKKAQGILEAAGLSALWAIYEAPAHQYEEQTIKDIVRKLVLYGSVSDRALQFAASLLERIGKRAEVAAQRAAEAEAAAPCPTGRVKVTGTILSLKSQDSQWGIVYKMLVKAESGFKVWCTCPGSPEKGDKVSFAVTLEPKADDPKFGFGSRPAKFEIIERAIAVA